MRSAAALMLLIVLAMPILGGAQAADLDCGDCGEGACAGDCCACPCCSIQAATEVPQAIVPSASIYPACPPAGPAPRFAEPLGVFHVPKSA